MTDIRKYQSSDRAALIDLWGTVFPDGANHNEPGFMIDQKIAVDDLVFVAPDNNKLMGACMAGYDGHRGWLYALAVRPEQRSKGLGTSLVEHVTQELRRLGCVKLNLQVRSGNDGVRSFYEKLGFTPEARISMGRRL